MTFSQYVQSRGKEKFAPQSLADVFTNEYLSVEFAKQYTLLKPKDFAGVDALRTTAQTAWDAPGALPAAKFAALTQLLNALDVFAVDLAARLGRREMKAQTEKAGRIAAAHAATPVQPEARILGERVLHFTTAYAPIVASNKLRITSTSDQGCVFCVPARYADAIAQEPPARVKRLFAIKGDLSHYVEFNLERSHDFESYNSYIDPSLKGQKELKVHAEILQLSRRDPQWYQWLGKSHGGWVLVPGPYAWGTA